MIDCLNIDDSLPVQSIRKDLDRPKNLFLYYQSWKYLNDLKNNQMNVLVTGGAGYIGTHTVVELLNDGHHVIVLDNLSNSSLDALEQVSVITKTKLQDSKSSTGRHVFIKGDLRDRNLISKIFSMYPIDAVIHFAGLKSISESVAKPLDYYSNNVIGSIILFEEILLIFLLTIDLIAPFLICLLYTSPSPRDRG